MMMLIISKIVLLGLKRLVGTISFLLLATRFASVVVDGRNAIRSLSGPTLITSTESQMIDKIGSIQNLKDHFIDDIKSKENNNDGSISNQDSDSKIPLEKKKVNPDLDSRRAKTGIDTEELSCLDQLPVKELESGKQQMSQLKLIICGIARDNAIHLPPVMKYIELTGQLFSDYRVIIFENDSVDGTKDLLKKWESTNDKVKIITHDYQNKKRPAISFLAEARNYYLYEISNNTDIYHDYDMMMVVDMDMKYGWDMRGIYHSLNRVNDWDMMCSNGISHHFGRMYDMFAFEIIEHSQDDYFFQIERRGRRYNNEFSWYFPPDSALVPVISCFGGSALYRLSAIEGCYYDSLAGGCEHKPFHSCMSSKHQGRLYLNPAQIIRYPEYV